MNAFKTRVCYTLHLIGTVTNKIFYPPKCLRIWYNVMQYTLYIHVYLNIQAAEPGGGGAFAPMHKRRHKGALPPQPRPSMIDYG